MPDACVVSFNQEARRVGFWGCAGGCGFSGRSTSSSELARASESGVDLRPLNLSMRIEELLECFEGFMMDVVGGSRRAAEDNYIAEERGRRGASELC